MAFLDALASLMQVRQSWGSHPTPSTSFGQIISPSENWFPHLKDRLSNPTSQILDSS